MRPRLARPGRPTRSLALAALLLAPAFATAAEPDARLKGFRVPKGFKVQVAASEPALENPAAMAFDDDGGPPGRRVARLRPGLRDLGGTAAARGRDRPDPPRPQRDDRRRQAGPRPRRRRRLRVGRGRRRGRRDALGHPPLEEQPAADLRRPARTLGGPGRRRPVRDPDDPRRRLLRPRPPRALRDHPGRRRLALPDRRRRRPPRRRLGRLAGRPDPDRRRLPLPARRLARRLVRLGPPQPPGAARLRFVLHAVSPRRRRRGRHEVRRDSADRAGRRGRLRLAAPPRQRDRRPRLRPRRARRRASRQARRDGEARPGSCRRPGRLSRRRPARVLPRPDPRCRPVPPRHPGPPGRDRRAVPLDRGGHDPDRRRGRSLPPLPGHDGRRRGGLHPRFPARGRPCRPALSPDLGGRLRLPGDRPQGQQLEAGLRGERLRPHLQALHQLRLRRGPPGPARDDRPRPEEQAALPELRG